MPTRRSPVIKRKGPTRFKHLRVAALALVVLAVSAWCWPRPDNAQLARSNGEVLGQLVDRYASEHHGTPCADLGTLVAAAESSGYNVRVRNPYSGVIASFDDPAIARPLSTHHGKPDEAGVVFYQAMPDALGRVSWLIRVATETGKLQQAQLPNFEMADQTKH